MKKQAPKQQAFAKPLLTRKLIGVVLWAAGIAAGIFGGTSYGLPFALALFVVGFFLFVSGPAEKGKH